MKCVGVLAVLYKQASLAMVSRKIIIKGIIVLKQ